MTSWIERARAKAHAAMQQLPGRLGDAARRANDALGRPLADVDELADRRAFATVQTPQAKPAAAAPPATAQRDIAPVVVFHMDKSRRDAQRLIEILEGAGIPHEVRNLEEDAAGQAAVRRDSKGHRLPVVFIAGEVVGGRVELLAIANSGELKKRVLG